MPTIDNAPDGALAPADVTADVHIPVSKLGSDYYLALTSALVAVITKNFPITGKGADVASAAAVTLGTDGNQIDITGTTTITSINTIGIGALYFLHFDDALILTHHATNLILPSAANITTAPGDQAIFYEYATGDWRCLGYTRADGSTRPSITAITSTATAVNESYNTLDGTSADYTVTLPPAATAGTRIEFHGLSSLTKIVTIDGNGAETINGESMVKITAGDHLLIESTGAHYRIISHFAAESHYPDVVLEDQKAAGTNGGGSAAGRQVRVLNTVVRDARDLVTLSSNQFSPDAGTYRIRCRCRSYRSQRAKLILYNATNSSDILIGESSYSSSTDGGGYSELDGIFTIAAGKSLEIRQYIQTAYTTLGLGIATNEGTTEVYTRAELWRLL